MGYFGLALGALLVVLLPTLWRALVKLLWRPYALTRAFRKQGIGGPAYRFWSGSTGEMTRMRDAARDLILDSSCHDFSTRVLVHYRKWLPEYGNTFLYWIGTDPRVCLGDIEMVKQVLGDRFGFYPKTEASPALLGLLGKGLVFVEGTDWVKHRRVVSPAFAMDKLKLMTKTMAECAKEMLALWSDQINKEEDQKKEIDVSEYFQELTADVISHTAFGSSYKEGKEVFVAQRRLQVTVAESFLRLQFPGSNYLPTKRNLEKWKLEKTLKDKLTRIISDRLDSKENSGYKNDLLGLMLEATQNEDGQTLRMDEIIDECKTFFFAGQETTSHLLTWAMFLLSTNEDWQEKLREEVLRECGLEVPSAEMLSKLKLVNMVILETLRLYSPVVLIGRRTSKDMKLGNINIPKDITLMIPIMYMHRDKRVWGADAQEFNPLRFENGVMKAAAHPNAMLSFSIGPRVCIGQNFAIMEAKIVLAMLLQRFSFSISPKYKHCPVDLITLQPKFGVPVVLRPYTV